MGDLSSIAIVGATGAVGREIISVLHRLKVPVSDLKLYASESSAGKSLTTPFGDIRLRTFDLKSVKQSGVVFLAVSGDFARENAPTLAQEGSYVIDNSSAFRYDDAIPLIVPQVNAASLGTSKLIANPNCTTAILVLALEPLRRAFGLNKVIVSTYQAASGAGAKGMDELEDQARKYPGNIPANKVFSRQLLFNLIPHIDSFQENGYTREEMKVVWETRKIIGMADLAVSCTAVRVPTLRVHAESVSIETIEKVTVKGAQEALSKAPGIKLVDNPELKDYPTPLSATGQFDVQVGRVRMNPVFRNQGLDLFICGDQLLRGAALNAVEILQCIRAENS